MKDALRKVLSELVDAMPQTPLVLLSGLAAGSDQLAASWALEWAAECAPLDDGSPRLSVVAVLPLPLERYRADFDGDAAGLAELESLLARAAYSVTLPALGVGQVDREACYSNLGSFLAEQSQLLVAFWDGQCTLRRGGTYHVIQKCLRSDPAAAALDLHFHRRRHLLVAPNEVDVRIIPVRRDSSPSTEEAYCGGFGDGVASAEEQGAHLEYRACLDALNRRLDTRALGPGAQDLRSSVDLRFCCIDSVASRMKRVFLRHVTALSVLSVVAILCFQLFSFNNREGWAAVSYVVLTLSVLVWFLYLRHFSAVEWVFVYSRAVAEAMRVQLAWLGSGLDVRVSEQYMSRRSLDVGILRRLVSAATLETLADAIIRPPTFESAAARDWIDAQRAYMRARIEGNGRRRSIGAAISGAVLAVIRFIVRIHWILVPATVAVLAWLALRGNRSAGVSAEQLLPLGAFLIGTILFLKSGVEYHDNAVLSREDIERFRRMLPVYDKSADLLGRASTDADRRRILTALGKEAIDENAEWFVKHTDALKMPTVG